MLRKKKEIALVVFDIDSDKSFKKLKAVEKIELIKNRLHETCRILQKQNPRATWIVSWREYGIRERNTNSISNKIKNKFKKNMLSISKQYPNLIIIAGTVLVRKKRNVSHLEKIKDYYSKLQWADDIEKEENDHEFKQHKKQIEILSKKINEEKLKKIRVTSNKARVYYHGIEKRHGKTTPFDENRNISDAIYQPGKDKNLDPVIVIDEWPHYFSIGIDICREHLNMFQYLKYTVENENDGQKPLLHFIISATIDLDLKSVCAKLGAVHVDSKHSPKLVLSRGYLKQNIAISLYQCHVMTPIKNLIDPITPEYPIQYKLLDQIEELIRNKSVFNDSLLKLRETILDKHLDYYCESAESLKLMLAKQALPDYIKADLYKIVESGTKPLEGNTTSSVKYHGVFKSAEKITDKGNAVIMSKVLLKRS